MLTATFENTKYSIEPVSLAEGLWRHRLHTVYFSQITPVTRGERKKPTPPGYRPLTKRGLFFPRRTHIYRGFTTDTEAKNYLAWYLEEYGPEDTTIYQVLSSREGRVSLLATYCKGISLSDAIEMLKANKGLNPEVLAQLAFYMHRPTFFSSRG